MVKTVDMLTCLHNISPYITRNKTYKILEIKENTVRIECDNGEKLFVSSEHFNVTNICFGCRYECKNPFKEECNLKEK